MGTISELIAKLQAEMAVHGDIKVVFPTGGDDPGEFEVGMYPTAPKGSDPALLDGCENRLILCEGEEYPQPDDEV